MSAEREPDFVVASEMDPAYSRDIAASSAMAAAWSAFVRRTHEVDAFLLVGPAYASSG
jgi:hypothetical protein